MPSPAYFRQFGIASIDDAFDEASCRDVRAAMDGAVGAAGTVWNPGHGDRVTAEKRRTELLGLPDQLLREVRARLDGHRDELEAQLGWPLGPPQPCKFVRYDPGDGYGLHRDRSDHLEVEPIVRVRRTSIVVFLNDPGDDGDPGGYLGGQLTFHGLVDEPPWNRTGHPLDAHEGLLVAFSPDLLHQVTPVTAGSRYTLVTWYE